MIGNDSTKAYELIIYKDKQNILTRAKLQPTFTYSLLRDNFASFFDDQNQNWSVLFDNARDYTEFCAELEKRNVKVVENFQKLEQDTKTEPVETKTESSHVEDHSDSSGAQMKANILSRMAKMGQPILPMPTQNVASDYADSDSDLSNNSRKSRKAKQPEKPPIVSTKPDLNKPKQLPLAPASSSTMNVQMVPVQNMLPQYQGQMILSHQALVSPTVDPLNLLLAENRTHNCEIRMNLSNLSNKVDEVLKKIEQSDKESAEEKLLRAKVQALELKVASLMTELQETVNTNIDLQRKLLDSKNLDVINDNNVIEASLKEKNDVILQQNRKIADLEEQVKKREANLKLLEEENESFKRNQMLVNDISVRLENDNFELDEFDRIYSENMDNEIFLKNLYKSLFKQIDKLKKKHNVIQNVDAKTNNAKVENFIEKLNSVLQDFEQYILKHVDSTNNTFPSDFVTKLLPKSIRTATNYLIKEFEKDFKVSDDTSDVFRPDGVVSELSD